MSSVPDFTKVDLQREGYGSEVGDPRFVRIDAERTYVPLDAESLSRAGYPPFEAED